MPYGDGYWIEKKQEGEKIIPYIEDDDYPQLFSSLEGWGSGGGRGGRSKKRDSCVRRVCSHRFLLVWDIGCEGKDEILMVCPMVSHQISKPLDYFLCVKK